MPYTSGLMRPAVIVYIDASVLSLASGLVLHVRVKSQRGASPVPNVTERAIDRRAKSRMRHHWSVAMGRTRVRGSKLRYERASGSCNDVTDQGAFPLKSRMPLCIIAARKNERQSAAPPRFLGSGVTFRHGAAPFGPDLRKEGKLHRQPPC
jgi:hypothetical protein